MVKIKALTALWQRPNVTRICFEGLKRLQSYKPNDYNITVQCVGSQPTLFEPMCGEYGFAYTNYPNRPLGVKYNAGLEEALKNDWDFLMIVNSDDIISNSLLDFYDGYYKSHYMVGVRGCYFYDMHSKKMVRFNGYENKVMSMGPGRIIHRDVIRACGGKMWDDNININLNGSCLKNANRLGYDETIVNPEGVYVVDIKTKTNLHSFGSFNGEKVNPSSVFRHFSKRERELLRSCNF